MPLLIGYVFEKSGGYFYLLLIFSSFGILALIFTIFLKIEDKKKKYGLELPNIKSKNKEEEVEIAK